MMQYEMKARTAYQNFKLIMELFEHYAQLLVEQCWLEVVVFEIPRVNLTRQDQDDLRYIISSKVPVRVIFQRTMRRTIQVTVKRIKGEC